MKKTLLVAFLLTVSLAVSGCSYQSGTYSKESQKLEAMQEKMIDNVPIPQIDTSLERANVAKRAEIFNKQDKISYIYLISYGKVMDFYTVKGKVSSLQSYMTPQEQIVSSRGIPCSKNGTSDPDKSDGYCTDGYVISAPDVDGTFGNNVEGVFFFTPEGTYVEWHGDYMMTDQPRKIMNTPELVRQVQ